MHCLKCEKPLKMMDNLPNNPENAGDMSVSFGYGSRWDMCEGMPVRRRYEDLSETDQQNRPMVLTVCCHSVMAYICDDCFAAHSHLFDGFVKEQVPPPKYRKLL